MLMNENKVILLVEDDAVTAIYEEGLLKKNGFKTIVASTGEQAVEIISNGTEVDLILMDINLGSGMDGTEAAGIILKKKDVPVVFMSNHTEPEIVDRTEKITSYGYIVKNSDATVIIASIKMAFRLHETKFELKKREEHFRLLVENAPDAIFIQTRGVFSYLNSAALNLFGAKAEEELLGHPVYERFHPDFHNFIKERIRLANEEKKHNPLAEEKYVRLDGTVVDVEATSVPIVYNDEDGALVFVRDITQKKQIKNVILQNERKFRSFVETTRELIWSINAECSYTYCNPAIREILGFDSEEFVNRNYFNLIHPDDKADTIRIMEEKIRNKTGWSNLVICRQHKNGSFRYLESSAVPIFSDDGALNGFQGADRDITVRILMEDALRESEERFREIFEQGPVGTALTDREFHFVQANDAFCRMTGYEREELKKMTFKDITHPDFIDESIRQIDRLDRGEINLYKTEKKYVRKDGSAVWGVLNATVLKDKKGEVMHHLIMVEDITRNKEIESALEKSLNEKESLLRELQHRIKNSFNIITSIMNLELDRMDSSKKNGALLKVRNRINSVANLYNMLASTEDLKKIKLDVYLAQMIDSLKSAYVSGSDNIKFDVKLNETLIDVKQAVPAGLIVNELLTNSIKYAFKGKNDGVIEIKLDMDKNNIILFFRDNGSGLPPDFDINKTESLGLMLVKMLTNQIDGKLEFLKGEGTSVLITIPSGL